MFDQSGTFFIKKIIENIDTRCHSINSCLLASGACWMPCSFFCGSDLFVLLKQIVPFPLAGALSFM